MLQEMTGRGRYFHKKQRQKYETNDKPTNNAIDGSPNNGDANHIARTGFICLCSETYNKECFKYGVVGFSKEKKYIMDMITKGMCLFFFNTDLKLLYGIYMVSSCTAFMLEPNAFGGQRPWQVKFHVERDCLPLREHVFKAAIEDNYGPSGNFKTMLNAEQVQKLVSLFSPLPGGPVRHPSANASNHHVTSCTNAATFVEKGGHIQDIHTEDYIPLELTCEANNAAGFVTSDPLLKLTRRPTQPLGDTVMTDECMHGFHPPGAKYGFLPSPTCKSKVTDKIIQSDSISRFNHEPAYPPSAAVSKFVHGYCAHQAKHGSLPSTLTCEANKADEFTQLSSLNCEPTQVCIHCYHAPTAKNSFLTPKLTWEAKKMDTSIQDAPLPRGNREGMHPLNDAIVTEKHMHDYHAPAARHGVLPPMVVFPAKTYRVIQSASLVGVSQENIIPLVKPAMVEKCIHGYHAPSGKHDFTRTWEANKADKIMCNASSILDNEPTPDAMSDKCMHSYHASQAKHGSPPSASENEPHKADGFLKNEPWPRLNQQPTHHSIDATDNEPAYDATSYKCMHNYYASTAKYGFFPSASEYEPCKADGFLENGPWRRLNQEPSHPSIDAPVTEKCPHGCHVSQVKHQFHSPTLIACEASKPDSLLHSSPPKLNLMPSNPLDVVMPEKCTLNYHTLAAKNEQKYATVGSHKRSKVERDAYMSQQVNGSSPEHGNYHASPPSGPLCAVCATSELKNSELNHLRTGDLGNLVSNVDLSHGRKGYLMPNAVHGILLERNLHEDKQTMDASCSLCSDGKIAPTGSDIFNALPGHATKNLHKRTFQDTYTYEPSAAAQSVTNTSRERPMKCMHNEVCSRLMDDSFACAVDGVPMNGYNPSLLHTGNPSFPKLPHGNSQSTHCIGCGW